jgi:hypothetical protein
LEDSKNLKDGGLSYNGGYVVYVLPAIRLALVAIGQHFQLSDPALKFMNDRIASYRVLHEHGLSPGELLTPLTPVDDWRISKYTKALADHDRQLQLTPNDERLWLRKAIFLLLLRHHSEAVTTLHYCLSLPWCDPKTQIDCKYNLACAFANLGQLEDCRQLLGEVLREQAWRRDDLAADPDFGAIRDESWFQQMLPHHDES